MTGLTLTVDDTALRAKFDELTRKVGNPAPILDDIGALLESRVQQRFDFKRDPNGAAWKPWAPSTAKQRSKEGRGELLIHGGKRSQHLLGSLSHQLTGDAVEVGFGAGYALFHEFGTKNMPRRGLLTADPETGQLGEEDTRTILDAIVGYLSDG